MITRQADAGPADLSRARVINDFGVDASVPALAIPHGGTMTVEFGAASLRAAM
jgi:hypothetical protein